MYLEDPVAARRSSSSRRTAKCRIISISVQQNARRNELPRMLAARLRASGLVHRPKAAIPGWGKQTCEDRGDPCASSLTIPTGSPIPLPQSSPLNRKTWDSSSGCTASNGGGLILLCGSATTPVLKLTVITNNRTGIRHRDITLTLSAAGKVGVFASKRRLVFAEACRSYAHLLTKC